MVAVAGTGGDVLCFSSISGYGQLALVAQRDPPYDWRVVCRNGAGRDVLRCTEITFIIFILLLGPPNGAKTGDQLEPKGTVQVW